jgi:hypothetical protein
LTGVAFAAGAAAGATSAGGVAVGAGVGGTAFVLFCATALVASITPNINQQFVFIFLQVKF